MNSCTELHEDGLNISDVVMEERTCLAQRSRNQRWHTHNIWRVMEGMHLPWLSYRSVYCPAACKVKRRGPVLNTKTRGRPGPLSHNYEDWLKIEAREGGTNFTYIPDWVGLLCPRR